MPVREGFDRSGLNFRWGAMFLRFDGAKPRQFPSALRRRRKRRLLLPKSLPQWRRRPQLRLSDGRGSLRSPVALFGLGLVLGMLRKPEDRTSRQMGPAAEEIWGPWVNSSREAVICLSNPDAAVLKRLDQSPGADYKPKRFPMHASDEAVVRDALRPPPGGRIYFTPATNMGKMGEAVAGVFLGAISDAGRNAGERDAKPHSGLGRPETAEFHHFRQ